MTTRNLLLACGFGLLSLGASAQETQAQKEKAQIEQLQNPKNYLTLQDGKMMIAKDGKLMSMERDVTLSNGTAISTAGKVTTKDGKSFQLKNADVMDMNGILTNAANKPK